MKKISIIILLILSVISVNAQISDGGTLELADDTVCYGNNNGMLVLNSEVGDVQYWEYSISGESPWITINQNHDTLEYNNLTETTYFRAIVKGSTPQDTSTIAVVHVSQISVAGTLSQNMEVCASSNSETLQLTGYTGKVDYWEYSNDNGTTWNAINIISDTYSFTNLLTTNLYRVIVKSGACSSDTSNTITITVYPQTNAGTLSQNDSVCYGNNYGEAILTSFTGDIVRWETSPTGYAPWATINHSKDTLSYTNLVSTNYYRAVVKSGVCQEYISNEIAIAVSPVTEGGIISGSQEVCSEVNTGTLVLSSYTGGILNWQYSHDFGTTWTDTANINHTLNYSGLIQTTVFRAVVRSGACDTAFSEISTITVNPLPDVAYDYDTVCRGQYTTFINNTSIATGSISTYSWDFGNGDGNNADNPVYKYPVDGTFTVKLTATSNKGCIDSLKQVVIVNPSPVVSYSFDNECDRDTVDFLNASFSTIGGTLTYSWDFGDTTNLVSIENPSHLYANSNEYSAKLVVTEDATGCKDSSIQTVSVYPRAVPDFYFTNICNGNDMVFTNQTIVSSGNVNYYWTFGDGYYDSSVNPNHLYSSDGTYNVRLSATTENNCTDTISKNAIVFAQPTAEFSGNDICYTDTFIFNNESHINSGTMAYLWNFGSGDTSVQENPHYYYFSPGTYTVSLSVVSDSGCTSDIFHNVNVYSLPNVLFDVDDKCLYDSAVFVNNSTIQSGTLDYSWNFGDLTGSTLKNPNHKYDTAGVYAVKLIAIAGGMCSDSISKNIEIFPVPIPDFYADNVCDGEQSYFYDQTSIQYGSIQNFSWDFGDGTNSVQQNPVQQFLNPGTYNVKLSVTSNNYCLADTTKQVTVDFMPIADFSVYNVCDKNPISPSNTSIIQEGNMTYLWKFGDNDTSIVPEPNHLYSTSGIYAITLTTRSENGCLDSLIRNVQIYPLPNANAGTDTSISKGDEVLLNASGGNIYNWMPSTGLSNPIISNPTASPTETIQYVIQVEDLNGCINYDTVIVSVIDDYKISPNNIITPNGDGINDYWIIDNIDNYGSATVFIYDKWGNEIYVKTAYDNSWNGTNSNNDILPDGTYYYVITFDGSDVNYNGAVSILRNN